MNEVLAVVLVVHRLAVRAEKAQDPLVRLFLRRLGVVAIEEDQFSVRAIKVDHVEDGLGGRVAVRTVGEPHSFPRVGSVERPSGQKP